MSKKVFNNKPSKNVGSTQAVSGKGNLGFLNWFRSLPKLLQILSEIVLGGITLGGITLFSITVDNNNQGTQQFGSITNEYYAESSGENSSSGVASSSGVVGSSSSSARAGIGECSLDDVAVPCDSPHNQEIIGQADNCSIETLITYLGGNSEYDTVSPTVSFSQKDGACIVSLGKEIDRKIEGSWSEPNPILDPLRACYKGDHSSDPIGSCANSHVGEIVYSQKLDAADNMNCSNRAEEYMNSSIEKWSDEIDIREITSDNYRMCVAYTRDSSELLTGLRNIKNQAITTQSN